MTTLFLVFVVVMVLAFVGAFVFIRPTTGEKRIEERLSEYSRTNTSISVEESIMRSETLTGNPQFDAVLRKFEFATLLRTYLYQADLDWNVGYVFALTFAIIIAVLVLGRAVISNIWLLLLLSLAAASLPYIFIYLKRAARLRKFQEYLPEAVELMARAMRAGHPLASAVEMISLEIPPPVGPEFRRVFEEQSLGLPIREALLNLMDRMPIRDLQILITAMLVQKETGGNLVELLEKTATVLRERVRLLGQIRVHTAQGRMTGWILCILPFVMFILLSLISPGYTDVLIHHPTGQKLTMAGLVFMAIGVFFIRRIVDIKV